MRSEPEKILDRAEERLRELPHADGEETLNLLRGFLRMESHRLRMLHRFGLGGLEVARGRAQVLDALISHLYRLALEHYPGRRSWIGADRAQVAIAAVGGYGRGELCPCSDVDLLILYDRSSAEFAKFLANEMIYLMWDVGLQVGHSFRTPEQSVEMARNDATAENALLDARHLVGGMEVWEVLQSLLQRHRTKHSQRLVERIQDDVAGRYYGRLGETVLLQEPNVKESPGGLRDFHTILWLARGCWDLSGEALVPAGILSPNDWERALRGYDWMMRVRTEMHYLTGRRADQLTLALQPEVAAGLKFRPHQHLMAGEVFMREYYQHAETVHRVMRLVLAAASREKAKRTRQEPLTSPLGHSLVKTDGELRLGTGASTGFPSSPLDMIQVLSLAQKHELRVGEDIKNAIRNNLAMLRREWQRNPDMSREFLEMLRRPGHVGMALHAMHSCGFLGKYIPEFARVTRLMQADSVHRYTTDEHTLRAIELLDEIWLKAPAASLERYHDLTYHIPDPAPLYLGLLLHDIGKGLGGGHTDKGAQRAAGVCERLGLSPKQAAQVQLLVRQHLLLSHLSQRRDLSDRHVAQRAAALLEDLENLSMLTLLTYADTSAVAPEIWTEWKNVLLWELFSKVHDEFLGLETATAQEQSRLEEVRRRILELLQSSVQGPGAAALSPEAAQEYMQEHLSLLPRRYPLGHRPDLVAKQIVLAKRAAATGPAVDLIPVPEQGYTQLLLCCPDTPGLFARVAGTLAALEVNILGARLDTRKDGMAVDVLWISTAQRNVISDPVYLRRIGSTVEGVLKGDIAFDEMVSRIQARPLGPVLKQPQMSLNNEISDRCTVLEVLAEDRLGFAYSIANCLTRMGLNIIFAQLSTEKTMAFDVFYLTDSGGRKLPESALEDVLAKLEEALPKPGQAIANQM